MHDKIPVALATAQALLRTLEHLAVRDSDQVLLDIYNDMKPHVEKQLRRLREPQVVNYGNATRQSPLFPDSSSDGGTET